MRRYVLYSGKIKTEWLQIILGMSWACALGFASTPEPVSEPQDLMPLQFPTENRTLLAMKLVDFFQPTKSKRLNSGTYGFVRSTHPDEPPPYFDHFHEGIDIRPLRRDFLQRPLDPIHAAAEGEIVYANRRATRSNYGLYVILRHPLKESFYYTTYAHLATVRPTLGPVQPGDTLGVLGYTGAGLNRERAHLHFEVGFMVNRHFEAWFERYGKKQPQDTNEHGLYNGKNFLGIDPVPLLIASAQNKPLTLREAFALEEPCFQVRVPAGKTRPDWLQRFPWQLTTPTPDPELPPVAWEITCNRIGLPLKFTPSEQLTTTPTLTWFDTRRSFQDSFTRGLIKRQGSKASLTETGRQWFSLLTYHPETE
jgi:murein DD-endopeptidase MepM/ murein hydrolase activator NlpD